MKISFLTNLCFSILCFSAITQTHHYPWPLLLLLLLFSLFPFFLNYWLIPGGFAWRNQHKYSSFPTLPGPFGWPLLGIIPAMGHLSHRKLAELSASLGATRLMAFSMGPTRVIISSHPDTAKEILSGSAFSDRPTKESSRLLMFERAIGFAPSGEYWRNLRRIAANHMFSPRRISALEGLRQRIGDEMLERVRKEMEWRGFVEVRGIVQKGSLDNVVESLFGRFLGLERKEELSLMVEEGYELIEKFNWEDYFPLGFLDFYGVRRRCHKLAIKVNGLLLQVIEERRKEEGEYRGRDDFLSVLLTLPNEDQLSDSDMVAVLWEMIFRGTDVVAILLEWIMARMALHPDIQAKAQEEIHRCTCTNGHRHVRDLDIPNLPYLQAIVKEVLRLHPPGPLLSWARLATHDVHVGKFFVPAGTTAMVNMWAITHDRSIWKDPWAFRPERFMEEDISIMGSDLRLAPFGSGRRVCPGKALGLATVHLWLACLLQNFTWLPAQSVDLSECLRLSLEMTKPLACRVLPRRPTML
ncbi:cytochrome P450 78A5-like [Telopea speciosissima]|uniref:cytochrome P450 78A5-like n=1 Tax=Telopea speciosissima TaxID=54955 RepID=UPI001CC6B940|nr:cytochrome P450 78A5-like [Telopea speciosissima]